MPKSVLDFPQMETARQDDVLYILRGVDVDRDRKIRVVDLVDGIYRNAFSEIGTVSRGTATQVLARNGDFNGWLDLSATLSASEAASAAEFRPHVSRRPLAIYRSRVGETYTPDGYRSATPGYPRMIDTEIGAIGPGMEKRRTTTAGLFAIQDFPDWGAWDGSGAWYWTAPSPMSATGSTVAEYNQWDVGPLTERIDLSIVLNDVTPHPLGVDVVHVGLRVLPGWVGDLVIPFDVKLTQADIPPTSEVRTTLVFRLEDADDTQPLRYGGLAVVVALTGPTSLTFRGLLKLTRSATGALSYGWAKEYTADELGTA